jgi:hypothetical protein
MKGAVMAKRKPLTATTLVKMASRAIFGSVRRSMVVPNKKRIVTNWKKDDQ